MSSQNEEILIDTAGNRPVSIILDNTESFAFIAANNGNILKLDLRKKNIQIINTGMQSINTLLFTHSNSLWVGGSKIERYDSDTTERLQTIDCHNDQVIGLAADKERLISASEDCSVKLSNINKGKTENLYHHDECIISFSFSQELKLIVTASIIPDIKVYSLSTRSETHKIQLETKIWSLAFTKNSNYLVSGDHNGNISLWDSNTFNVAKQKEHHQSRVSTLNINDSFILSGSFDQSILLIDLNTFEAVQNFNVHSDWVRCARFTSRGFIGCGDDMKISIQILYQLKKKEDKNVTTITTTNSASSKKKTMLIFIIIFLIVIGIAGTYVIFSEVID